VQLDDTGVATSVLTHDYGARDREVMIPFPIGTLGDVLAWFSYAPSFAQVHGCRLTCALSGLLIPLLLDACPEIRFVTHQEVAERKLAATMHQLRARPVLRRRRERPSAHRLPPCRAGSHRRLYPRRRSGRGSAAPGLP